MMSHWFWDKHKQFDTLPRLKQRSNIGYRFNQPFENKWQNEIECNESDSNDERCWTPISEIFSESDSGTPDFLSEESDSSTGSALCRNTLEATKILAREWETIERTLYDEDGEKSTRPEILEECNQWKALHPQLRVLGRGIKLPQKKLNHRPIEYDEIIAIDSNDGENFDSDERLSQSSSDVTPCNSPRESISENLYLPTFGRGKINIEYPKQNIEEIRDTFSSLLQITPARVHSPSSRNICRSDIMSSKWMNRSDERDSAKSFISIDAGSSAVALSASSRRFFDSRASTARYSDLNRLEPICYAALPQSSIMKLPAVSSRKVSLPPLLLEEERRTKNNVRHRPGSRHFNTDKIKHRN